MRLGCVVLYQVHHAVEAAVHRAPVVVFAAEVVACGALLVAGHVDGVLHELVDALVGSRRNADHGDAEDALHFVDADGAAVAAHLVHHIERQHHRHVKLHQLQRQVQVALDVGRIDNVDKPPRGRVEYEFTGHYLLGRVGRKRIDAGQVGDGGLGVAADDSVLAVHGHAREIAYVLVGSGQDVEERGLAAVLLAGKRKRELGALGQRVLVVLGVVFAAFTQAGVRIGFVQVGVAAAVPRRVGAFLRMAF